MGCDLIMSYCTYDDVIKMSGTNARKFGYKDQESAFNALLTEWISQAESFINAYCRRDWNNYTDDDGNEVTVTVPPAIKNVCTRFVANIIAFNYKRRDDPIRKVTDYSVKVFESDIFTDDLKQDLKPFVKASKVAVFKI